MRPSLLSCLILLLSVSLFITDAEARRLGGGKSTGMQRESISQKSTSSTSSGTSSTTPQNAAAPAAAPKNNWLGPIAGLAAGIGLAALLSHFGLGENVANILLIALIAMLAIALIRRLLSSRAKQHSPTPFQYAGATVAGTPVSPKTTAGHTEKSMTPLPVEATVAGLQANTPHTTSASLPEGFDREAFTRIAKLNFLRLQTANDTRNYDDLREFLSPELFAEVKLQIDERGNATQITEVPLLNADILDVTSTPDQHIVSVRFHGMICEQPNTPATAFDEVWHLTKPQNSSRGWLVAGIQQHP